MCAWQIDGEVDAFKTVKPRVVKSRDGHGWQVLYRQRTRMRGDVEGPIGGVSVATWQDAFVILQLMYKKGKFNGVNGVAGHD